MNTHVLYVNRLLHPRSSGKDKSKDNIEYCKWFIGVLSPYANISKLSNSVYS